MPLAALILALCPALLLAAPAEELLARLIAEAWQQEGVRVEWSFSGPAPTALTAHEDWQLAQPRPGRLAGSLVLTLERTDTAGRRQRFAVSGQARVFGPALVPNQRVPAGQPVTLAALSPCDAEWTNLTSAAATAKAFESDVLASHALVPGRPVTVRDLKMAPVVRRGQPVNLEFVQGAVRVLLQGRALQDGAAGDVIAVAVEFERSRRLRGRVESAGRLTLVQ